MRNVDPAHVRATIGSARRYTDEAIEELSDFEETIVSSCSEFESIAKVLKEGTKSAAVMGLMSQRVKALATDLRNSILSDDRHKIRVKTGLETASGNLTSLLDELNRQHEHEPET